MNNDEYQALLKDTELRLDKLKCLYEQWFQGVERLEPRRSRDEIERRLAFFRKQPTSNTALRFRTQTLVQRFVTLQTHWNRVAREIEEGRYARDIKRARRLDRARARANAAEDEVRAYEIDVDVDLEELAGDGLLDELELDAALASLEAPPSGMVSLAGSKSMPGAPMASPPVSVARAVASAAPPKPSSPPPVPPAGGAAARFARPKVAGAHVGLKTSSSSPATSIPVPAPRAEGPGPTDERIRELFDRYVDARKRNNERVDNVRLETLTASIRKMVPELVQKHRGKRIDFEVVMKNGRVGLKPVPKD